MEKFIKDITSKAGHIVREKFGKTGVKYSKSNSLDVVTEADLASNEFLVKKIKEKFPDHGIISEETGSQNSRADNIWIIDPLDGTMNFSRNIPLFAVLVAYVEKSKLKAACVSVPMSNELFFAEAGKGAFLNGNKIHCSKKTTLNQSTGCSGSSHKSVSKKIQFEQKLLKKYAEDIPWVSSYASIGISGAYTASGRKDWYVSFSGCVWDFAAPVLLMQEAGLKVTNFKGKSWTLQDACLIAANPKLHIGLIGSLK